MQNIFSRHVILEFPTFFDRQHITPENLTQIKNQSSFFSSLRVRRTFTVYTTNIFALLSFHGKEVPKAWKMAISIQPKRSDELLFPDEKGVSYHLIKVKWTEKDRISWKAKQDKMLAWSVFI